MCRARILTGIKHLCLGLSTSIAVRCRIRVRGCLSGLQEEDHETDQQQRPHLLGVSLMAITPWSGTTTVKLPVNRPRSFFWYRSRTVACVATMCQPLGRGHSDASRQSPYHFIQQKATSAACQTLPQGRFDHEALI